MALTETKIHSTLISSLGSWAGDAFNKWLIDQRAAARPDESASSRSAVEAIANAITLNAGHEPLTTVAARVLRAIEQGEVPGVHISTTPG